MSVATPLAKSLEARTTWCRPDETICWVYPQRSLRYEVSGLDGTGQPLPGRGKRLGRSLGRAAGAVGNAALDLGLTVTTGPELSPERGGKAEKLPDVIVFGPDADTEAVRQASHSALTPLAEKGGLDLDNVPAHWILTTRRLALVSPSTVPDGGAERSGTSGLLRRAASWADDKLSGFGPNTSGAPMTAETLTSLLEVEKNKVAGFAPTERHVRGKYHELQEKCFRLTLQDGSGFDFCDSLFTTEDMLEMTSETFG